jgi:Putative prokaryotic signal transducing protein
LTRPPKKSSGPSPKRRDYSGVPVGWVEVACTPDQISAGMLESALKAEEIPVILLRPGVFPYLGIGGQHGVLVPEERAGEARDILREMWDIPEQEQD